MFNPMLAPQSKNSVALLALPKSNDQASITAFCIYDKPISKELDVALGCMESSDKWVVVRMPIDIDIANAFRLIKVPSLIMYNSGNEETARFVGEQNIMDMLSKVAT